MNKLCPFFGGDCFREKCEMGTYNQDGEWMMCAIRLIGETLNRK